MRISDWSSDVCSSDLNAGFDGAVVAGKLFDQKDANYGFNAATDVYEDLVKAGVIDPTKVVRIALQDAASVAGLLITTEAAVSELPEDKPAMPMGGGGMGGVGGMDFYRSVPSRHPASVERSDAERSG